MKLLFWLIFFLFLASNVYHAQGGFDATVRNLRGKKSKTSKSGSHHDDHIDHVVKVATREVLIVAGNFTVDGKSTSIGKYDGDQWSTIGEMDLHLFSEESGTIRDFAVLEYVDKQRIHETLEGEESKTLITGSIDDQRVFVVGEFDTATTSSQLQYCSVGAWNGLSHLKKVGEGLCPRGNDADISVNMMTITLGNAGGNQSLFVGGNFESRIWNGRHFIDVFNIARYDLVSNKWGPLGGYPLLDENNLTKRVVVTVASYDDYHKELYVGGAFQISTNSNFAALDYGGDEHASVGKSTGVTSVGLALWSVTVGLQPFTGGSLQTLPGYSHHQRLVHLYYDGSIMSLFVGGQFQLEGKPQCRQVAVWFKLTGEWTCLLNRFDVFKEISAVYMGDNGYIYVAGEVHKDYIKNIASQQQMYIPVANKHHIAVADLSEFRHNALYEIDKYKRAQLTKKSSHEGHQRKGDDDSGDDDSAGKSSQKHRKVFTSHGTHAATDINDTSIASNSFQWQPDWKWLHMFHGTDGHITRMLLGHEHLEGILIIAGTFTEYNSVLFWPTHAVEWDSHHHHRSLGSTSHNDDDMSSSSSRTNDKGSKSKIISSDKIKQLLMCNQTVNGTINSMAQVYVPVEFSTKVNDSDNNRETIEDYMSLVVMCGLFIVGVLGVFLANYCYKSSWAYELVDSDDHPSNFNLSLKMLGQGNESKLGHIFNEAMKARHLPTHETLLLIDPNDIILAHIIGEGSFGRVWSGQYHNNKVAVKEFVFAQAAVAGESLHKNRIIEEIVGEAGIMACLRHPKIIQIYGCCLTMQAIWITSELCGLGSLRMVLNNEKFMEKMDFLSELSICLDIADGCHYLHTRSPPIIHRDLKSHNIFIQEQSRGQYVAKIGDWGSARALALTENSTKNMTKGIGTACWLAPEVINHGLASKASDVYSFGIVLWEIMTRKEVYPGLSAEQIIAKVANSDLRPALPPDVPLSDMMRMCWKQNDEQRPTFHQILNTLSKLYNVVKKNPSVSKSKNNLGRGITGAGKSHFFSNTSDSTRNDDYRGNNGNGNDFNDSSDSASGAGVEMSVHYGDNQQPSSGNTNRSFKRENSGNTPIRRPLSVPTTTTTTGNEASSLLASNNTSKNDSNTKNHNRISTIEQVYGSTTDYGNGNGTKDQSTASTLTAIDGEISVQRLEMERETVTTIHDPIYAATMKKKDKHKE